MFGIGQFTKKDSWLDQQKNKKCKTWLGTALQFYIFHDITSVLVHILILLIAGALTNVPSIEESAFWVMYWIGLLPLGLFTLPYIIFGLIINPIKSISSKLKKKK
jgi:uncharacterized integral membrane protein